MISADVIADHIIPHVSLQTLLNMELVCVTWYYAVNNDWVWRKHMMIYNQEALKELRLLISFFTLKKSYFLLNRLHRIINNQTSISCWCSGIEITYCCNDDNKWSYDLNEEEANSIRMLLPKYCVKNNKKYIGYMYLENGRWMAKSPQEVIKETHPAHKQCCII